MLRDVARARVDQLMRSLAPKIHSRWPAGDFVDMLPVFDDHAWLSDVIRTGCVLAVNDDEHHCRCVAAARK